MICLCVMTRASARAQAVWPMGQNLPMALKNSAHWLCATLAQKKDAIKRAISDCLTEGGH